MVEIEPLRIDIDREEDGRILAAVPDLPGVMAYGQTQECPASGILQPFRF